MNPLDFASGAIAFLDFGPFPQYTDFQFTDKSGPSYQVGYALGIVAGFAVGDSEAHLALGGLTAAGRAMLEAGVLCERAKGSLAEAALLQSRASELNAARGWYGAQRGTTAVMNVQNRTTGEIQTWIATESNGAMEQAWNNMLNAGETYVDGKGHAEQTIFNEVGDDWAVLAGGNIAKCLY